MTKFDSNKFSAGLSRLFSLTAMLVLLAPAAALAAIDGNSKLGGNPFFQLTASEGYVSIADGASIYSWGYAYQGGLMTFVRGYASLLPDGRPRIETIGGDTTRYVMMRWWETHGEPSERFRSTWREEA